MNPFRALWDGLNHLATQSRRLGDVFGAMADQAEQRSGEAPPAVKQALAVNRIEALEAPKTNGRKKAVEA